MTKKELIKAIYNKDDAYNGEQIITNLVYDGADLLECEYHEELREYVQQQIENELDQYDKPFIYYVDTNAWENDLLLIVNHIDLGDYNDNDEIDEISSYY